jgi:hypothetical protein
MKNEIAILKLYYIINHIIVKIHNNYKFRFEYDEESKRQIFKDEWSIYI